MNIFLSIILCIVSIVLILIILMQSSQNSGFQGDLIDINEQNFFSKNNGVEFFLKKITIIFGILFFVLVILLSYFV